MSRLVRLWTGDDGESHVTEEPLALPEQTAHSIRFQETAPRGTLDWHDAPHRQYVITLTGTLRFTTRGGETFVLAPGDVLLAEDTTGGGHRWELIDDKPWRRLYVTLGPAD